MKNLRQFVKLIYCNLTQIGTWYRKLLKLGQ